MKYNLGYTLLIGLALMSLLAVEAIETSSSPLDNLL